MKQIGTWIADGTWSWDNGPGGGIESDLLIATTRGYAVYIWQTLQPTNPWYVWTNDPDSPDYPGDFPGQYSYQGKWLSESYGSAGEIPPIPSMSDLFDPNIDGQTFPLAVPLGDFYEGTHGWPGNRKDHVSLTGPHRPVVGVAIPILAEVSRDVMTGEVVARIILRNQGATTASNVEITDATLHGRRAVAVHIHQFMRLHTNQPWTFVLRFPKLPSGKDADLRV